MIDEKKLATLDEDIYAKARVDREHLLEFLTLVTTNDGESVAAAVRKWLEQLHADPKYDHIYFPTSEVEAILGDLGSYGRLQPNTILGLKQGNSHELRAS